MQRCVVRGEDELLDLWSAGVVEPTRCCVVGVPLSRLVGLPGKPAAPRRALRGEHR